MLQERRIRRQKSVRLTQFDILSSCEQGWEKSKKMYGRHERRTLAIYTAEDCEVFTISSLCGVKTRGFCICSMPFCALLGFEILEPIYESTSLSRNLGDNLLTCDDLLEREVKKANRELNNLTSKMDDLQKIETLQKRVTEHLADMKRLERENLKNKKRGDMLQKEKDHSRTELSKSTTLREKLEKLCRELQRENNRLKVCS